MAKPVIPMARKMANGNIPLILSTHLHRQYHGLLLVASLALSEVVVVVVWDEGFVTTGREEPASGVKLRAGGMLCYMLISGLEIEKSEDEQTDHQV